MNFTCGPTVPAAVLRQIVGLRDCCMGAVNDGPSGCTCWEPVYDLEQTLPLDKSAPITTRERMCEDCAFRPDSPERSGDDRYAHAGEELDELDHFWCHQGMRKPVAWRHPTLGITVEADTDGYDPPRAMVGERAVPFRADGTPGQLCAGFTARQRQLAGQAVE